MAAAPYWREAGSGPAVVCIHANASVSGQWRGLMDRLADRYRVLAPDCYGSGRSPDWPSADTIALQDEVDLLAPVFDAAGERFVLVGHSYGAGIALRAALQMPRRVRAMVLYEPTLFALIGQEGPPPNDADGIQDAVERAGAALDAGDRDEAARCFIDYWMGEGAWARTPAERRPAIAEAVTRVRRWRHALVTEPTPLAAFRALAMPVLLLTGSRTTASARGVATRLLRTLPQVRHQEIGGVGHMAPVTHPDLVNDAIERWLETLPLR
jgi:pimeloyl-ACP methyl ester carboxylesterase